MSVLTFLNKIPAVTSFGRLVFTDTRIVQGVSRTGHRQGVFIILGILQRSVPKPRWSVLHTLHVRVFIAFVCRMCQSAVAVPVTV
jgi:hypothetical protein